MYGVYRHLDYFRIRCHPDRIDCNTEWSGNLPQADFWTASEISDDRSSVDLSVKDLKVNSSSQTPTPLAVRMYH